MPPVAAEAMHSKQKRPVSPVPQRENVATFQPVPQVFGGQTAPPPVPNYGFVMPSAVQPYPSSAYPYNGFGYPSFNAPAFRQPLVPVNARVMEGYRPYHPLDAEYMEQMYYNKRTAAEMRSRGSFAPQRTASDTAVSHAFQDQLKRWEGQDKFARAAVTSHAK